MDKTAWICVGPEDLVPRGEGRRVARAGKDVALFRTAAGWFAVDALCPHKAGPLADGIVAGSAVTCPLHAWKIDLATGCAAGGEGRVRTYRVKAEGGQVYVAIDGEDRP
jgi:nitrite reductase (NADH) small subunit